MKEERNKIIANISRV